MQFSEPVPIRKFLIYLIDFKINPFVTEADVEQINGLVSI